MCGKHLTVTDRAYIVNQRKDFSQGHAGGFEQRSGSPARVSGRSFPSELDSQDRRLAPRGQRSETMAWQGLKLNLRVAQKQILTPGLVQMVSVLALNRLELREMINQEMMANPVLEELSEEPTTYRQLQRRNFPQEQKQKKFPKSRKPNPFDEFDVGTFFQSVSRYRRRRRSVAGARRIPNGLRSRSSSRPPAAYRSS